MKKVASFALLLSFSLPVFSAPPAHWTYEGKAGPEHWADLSPEFATCHSGKFQSPIDIRMPIDAQLPALKLSFHSAAEKIVNNGHTLQVTVNDEADFPLDGETFALMQYHFHTPSENLINGKSFPLEAHFVHSNEQGELAVVAVMFEVGAENSALKPILQALPDEENKTVDVSARYDLKPLFPDNLSYYRFSGSLTTPPCTEGLRWLVLKKPVTLSAEQLAVFQKALRHSNNRPVQPLHGRMIVE